MASTATAVKLVKVTEATQEACHGKMGHEIGVLVLNGDLSPEQAGAFLVQRMIAKADRKGLIPADA